MSHFADQVILITGAGNGIGRELARQLSQQGAKIAALDQNEESLQALQSQLSGATVVGRVADVTDLEATRAAVQSLEEDLGPIDLLIASAGIGRATPAEDFRAEDIAVQIQVNLIGVANSIDAVLAGMRERKKGHLVALSSLASYRGLPHMAGYCASKAGLNAMLDSLRLELAEHGIAVTAICPGWIQTDLTKDISVPHLYMMELEYAVKQMMKAIRKRKPYYVFPSRAAWQLRFLCCLPSRWSDRMIRRKMRRITGK